MIRRWLVRIVAIVSIALCAVVAILDGVRGWSSGGFSALYAAVAVVFIGVGWLIVERRPGNAVGPLLLAFGALFAAALPADLSLRAPGDSPTADLTALFVSMLDAPMLILISLALLLYPDGRPPSPRWRWVMALAGVGIGLGIVGWLFGDQPMYLFPEYRSRFAIPGFRGDALVYAGYAIMLVLLVAAAAALVVRWRRGNALERAQIKWVVAAAAVLVVAEIANVATFDPAHPNGPIAALASIAIALVPLAMGIAILRYRLYEIDRVISRTLSYAIVTGVLGAVFVGVILLFQAALADLTSSNGIPVAISTLAVFALFQPVLRRVQRVVDQRFDRARFDADRMTAAFSDRLRDQVDIATVTTDLDLTIRSALRPASVGLWLRRGTDR